MQSSALTAAGFPQACGNVVTNATALREIFDGRNLTVAHYLLDYKPSPCISAEDAANSCVKGYCPGYPSTAGACRFADGLTPERLTVGAGTEPTTYATVCIGISIIAQVGT